MVIIYLIVVTLCAIACMIVGSGLVEVGRKQAMDDIVQVLTLGNNLTKKPKNEEESE